MNCKKCIHYDVCLHHEDDWITSATKNGFCGKFKNREEFVKKIHAYWNKDPVTGFTCCSNCKAPRPGDANLEAFYNSDFCPCCGADMVNYYEEVEVCPYCDQENVYPMWNTEEQGFIATCHHCGKEIFLCSACQYTVCEDGEPHNCDWRETDCGGKCHRGETTRKKASGSDE